MTVNHENTQHLYDAKVVTQDGDNLGGVGQVYLDDRTGQPSWVSVKTGWFGTNESLVPLDGAKFTDGEIHVPFTKDVIKDAPNVDAEHHLSD
ncbi:PRC-barrel domain-containing protein [Ornithinimicrobium sp. Y1847]|uniref:PRC-barrel domain-containing protein n=1 Tax=Ornithinimicrobium sp. Y1847 TaxID=3405419 RepID=UPI003B67B641